MFESLKRMQPVYDYEAKSQAGCLDVRSFVLDNVRSEKVNFSTVTVWKIASYLQSDKEKMKLKQLDWVQIFNASNTFYEFKVVVVIVVVVLVTY